MTECPNISILYLSIGSGHQMAAEAIAEAIQRASPQSSIRVFDPFASSIDILPSILEQLQAASVMLTPGIYDTIWRLGTGGNIFEWVTDLEILRKLLIDSLCANGASDIIIATHVLPCSIAVTMRKSEQARKVYGVVTDFGLHTLWPISGVDGYFVGHSDVRNTMIYRGVHPDTVHVTGIPIRLEFENSADHHSIPLEKKLRMLLIAGGIRGGAYTEVKQYIIDLLDGITDIPPNRLKITIVTGKDQRLRDRLEEYAQSSPLDIQVRGFVTQMYAIIKEHDVMIGKPGGLIVSEALACGICLILIKPGPGQENANVDFLARHGVAFRGETVSEVVKVLHRCVDNPEMVQEMKARARQLGCPKASMEIATKILQET